MKKFFTLIPTLLLCATVFAQVPCTSSAAIDDCPLTTATTVTTFNNTSLFSGTALTVGAKYKYNNVTTIPGVPAQPLDAIVTIDAMSNATLVNASQPSIDDDLATDQNGDLIDGLFSPRIRPNSTLTCTDRRGYVQFTITFYPHFTGNILPASVPVSDLNFVHYDMDGFPVGSNGWFKEIGYVKRISEHVPVNYVSGGTELLSGGLVSDAGGDWWITLGSTTERSGVSKCGEVAEVSGYSVAQSAITFRMGYDYKAPVPCNGASELTTRQYGSKFGCFSLPSGGPLPVSLANLAVNYNKGVSTLSWTTYQEINLASYSIERSIDGINFTSVGTVQPNNLLTIQKYNYTDNIGVSGAKYLYYRVRIIDKNGTKRISNSVSIKTEPLKSHQLVITPNPSRNDAQIRMFTERGGAGSILVYDGAGKVVLKQQAQLLNGNNNIAINNLLQLSEGYYTVKLILNNETFSSKMIIWK